MNWKKNIFILIFILIVVIAFSIQALATPSISSYSRLIIDGGSVTISGLNFGSAPTVHKYDFFEQTGGDYDVGDPIANNWGRKDDGGTSYAPDYNATGCRTGSTKHIMCYMTASPNKWLSFFYYDHEATISTVYVTYWIKFDHGAGVSHVKYMQMWHNPETDMRPLVHFLVDCGTVQYCNASGEGGESVMGSQYASEAMTEDTWIRWEGYLKESDFENSPYPADGKVQYWIQYEGEGNTFDEVLNKDTKTNIDGGTKHWEIVNFVWMTHNASDVSKVYIDDVYISDTKARVEIGDNATWANCTHREIQIPTVWLDSSITVTINQGSFPNFDNLYFFVVDEDGNVSNGYLIKNIIRGIIQEVPFDF